METRRSIAGRFPCGTGTGRRLPCTTRVFRMLCNGTVVQERPGVRAYDEEDAVTYSTSWKPQPCEPGDELAETFTCTDDYGLTYTFVIARYWITGDGTLGEDYQDGDQYPTLTWE